jgi:hypothetical protein
LRMRPGGESITFIRTTIGKGGGSSRSMWVSPIARIDSLQRKPRHRMAGLVRKWLV